MNKEQTVRLLRKTFSKKRVISATMSVVRAFFLLSICYIILNPLITRISMSFMEMTDIYDPTVKVIPKHFTITNYLDAFVYGDYFANLLRSVLISLLVTVTQVASCIVTGYGFARFKFKGRGILFALVIIMMVVPNAVLITPQYINFVGARLVGSLWPFFLLGITGTGTRCGLYIFLARQYFRGIPKEIDEAAMIDGAGPYKVFSHIMLKSAVPTMVTIGLFSFVWQWGENSYTSMFYSGYGTLASRLSLLGYAMQQEGISASHMTVSMVDYEAFYSVVFATLTVLTILPLVIIYVFCQKSFMESIENTGIVG